MGNRLYVGNLAFTATAESLSEAFTPCGAVQEVHIVLDRETGSSRGFGFITMATQQGAANAISSLNGTLHEGRPLRVNEAEERRPSRPRM